MGYGNDVKEIIQDLVTKIEGLNEFNLVQFGYTAAIGELKNIPNCMVIMSSERIRESMGARAENRDLFVEFWTLNRESHERAIEHAGSIVDLVDGDKTLGGKVQWSILSNVECFIKPEPGYNLNWSKVTYKFERRRLR